MKHKNYYAIIMAGGVGSRFWPASKTNFPKQFHDMLGTGETLIQKTFSRLEKLVPQENIFILTNELYEDLVKSQLPGIQDRQIVQEPAMRNTAPCILYAALKIHKENPDAVIVVAPSDHWIEDENAFIENLEQSFKACSKDNILMTLGIQPTFPNTGYGYIQAASKENSVQKVKQFTEKPDYGKAQEFVASGDYYWNAGIFIWSAKSILHAFEKFQEEMTTLFYQGKDKINTPEEEEFIKENYPKAEDISIDYAILEKATNVFVLPATFDWNDLGAWGALYDKLPKNDQANAIVGAKTHLELAEGNLIRSDQNRIVVVKGLKDFIIVDDKDVLLIYPKSDEQEIKQIRKQVGDKFGKDYI